MTIGWNIKKFSFLELAGVTAYLTARQLIHLKLLRMMRKLGLIRATNTSSGVEAER